MTETHMEKIQRIRRERHAAGIKAKILTPTQRLAKNLRSYRQMVKAKCWDCSNHQRTEIEKCPVLSCPIWIARPNQRGEQSQADIDTYMENLKNG